MNERATVNQWSLAPIQHQQESPIWWVVKKETVQHKQLNSVIVWLWKQHSCEAALRSGGSGANILFILCSAPVRHLQCFSSSWVFSLQWKVYSLSSRGAGLYGQKSLLLVLDWSILMQMSTPNPHSLIGPKARYWFVTIKPLWLVRALQLWFDGESSVLLVEIRLQEFLCKGWLRWQKHSIGR